MLSFKSARYNLNLTLIMNRIKITFPDDEPQNKNQNQQKPSTTMQIECLGQKQVLPEPPRSGKSPSILYKPTSLFKPVTKPPLKEEFSNDLIAQRRINYFGQETKQVQLKLPTPAPNSTYDYLSDSMLINWEEYKKVFASISKEMKPGLLKIKDKAGINVNKLYE